MPKFSRARPHVQYLPVSDPAGRRGTGPTIDLTSYLDSISQTTGPFTGSCQLRLFGQPPGLFFADVFSMGSTGILYYSQSPSASPPTIQVQGWMVVAVACTYATGGRSDTTTVTLAQSFGAPRPSLPVRQQEDPIKAVKLAYLIKRDGRVRFKALNGDRFYDDDSMAACAVCGPHPGGCPEPGCSCGFYAMKPEERSRLDFTSHPDAVRLDVELSGRVIVGRLGYRAQRQQVMRVFVPLPFGSDWCTMCNMPYELGWISSYPPFYPSRGTKRAGWHCHGHEPYLMIEPLPSAAEMSGLLGTEVVYA